MGTQTHRHTDTQTQTHINTHTHKHTQNAQLVDLVKVLASLTGFPARLDCCRTVASLALMVDSISSSVFLALSSLHSSLWSSLSHILHRIWVLISSSSLLKLHFLQVLEHSQVEKLQAWAFALTLDSKLLMDSSSPCSSWQNWSLSTRVFNLGRLSLSISFIRTSGSVFLKFSSTLLEVRSFLLRGVSQALYRSSEISSPLMPVLSL